MLTFLRRVGDNREILDNPRIADALESWRLFMMTDDPRHIMDHSQHLFLADPEYGDLLPGIATSFRLFDVIHLATQVGPTRPDVLNRFAPGIA